MKKVKLEVTDKGAVYVNDTRITPRRTKWGYHNIIFSTETDIMEITQVLVDNGYGHIKLDTEYLSEFLRNETKS